MRAPRASRSSPRPWQGLLVAGLNSFTALGERTEVSIFGAEQASQ